MWKYVKNTNEEWNLLIKKRKKKDRMNKWMDRKEKMSNGEKKAKFI